ncbi:MAG TPA: queuosine salvage family protein [Solirubrobacteraceae bacterium]|nr:queuosine salvage family protein [Solirubrobacteraceae bacterium]
MSLTSEVRISCAEIAASARWVTIDLDAAAEVQPLQPPPLDPDCHYLEGEPDAVASYLLTLDAINFGSGWFPQLRKRMVDGRPVSGYYTIAWGLSDRFRADGQWSAAELRALRTDELAAVLGQPASLELMALYTQALRDLGRFLGQRTAAALVTEARSSAVRFAGSLAHGMAMFNDTGFYKRAQIAAHDLALAGVADFKDLDELTIFADNLVPHVLRCDGVLVYDSWLATRIDSGQTLRMGPAERELRACAVHACELIAARTGVPARVLDSWLWNRGQSPEYKARPRHRCRTVFY